MGKGSPGSTLNACAAGRIFTAYSQTFPLICLGKQHVGHVCAVQTVISLLCSGKAINHLWQEVPSSFQL